MISTILARSKEDDPYRFSNLAIKFHPGYPIGRQLGETIRPAYEYATVQEH